MSWVRYDFQNVRIPKEKVPQFLAHLADVGYDLFEGPGSVKDRDGFDIAAALAEAGYQVQIDSDGVKLTGFTYTPNISLEDWYDLRHLAGFVAEGGPDDGATITRLNFTEMIYREVEFTDGKAIETTGLLLLEFTRQEKDNLARIAEREAG